MKNKLIRFSSISMLLVAVLLVGCDGSLELPPAEDVPVEEAPVEEIPAEAPEKTNIIVVVPGEQTAEDTQVQDATATLSPILFTLICGIVFILGAIIFFGNRNKPVSSAPLRASNGDEHTDAAEGTDVSRD